MLKKMLVTFSLVTTLFATPSIVPIPEHIKTDPAKVKLGKQLYFDTQLSKNNSFSCASCHNIADGGDDNLQYSFGIKGEERTVNAPTVLNAVFNFRQFWDGRAKDLQAQASGPIENPLEMGNNFHTLIPKLNKTAYKKEFQAIYKDGITKKNIANAIAEYEKTLITPDAPFDLYLKGDKNAITQKQKEGYELFKTKGCIACHHGVNIGGNLYNKFGVFEDANSNNFGRYNVTHKERDKYYFKVPTLRNIALTAPYFHDGRTSSLHDAVSFMAEAQLGRKISKEELDKIVAFLQSLTGKMASKRENR